MKTTVAVIGPSSIDEELRHLAYTVGKLIAREGWVLVNGGRGGVMEASARGAKEEGGLVVGLLPSGRFDEANPYVDIVIPTGMGEMRNFLIIKAAHAVISVGYSEGTLVEISIANKLKKFTLGLKVPEIPGVSIEKAENPEEAILKVKKFLEVIA